MVGPRSRRRKRTNGYISLPDRLAIGQSTNLVRKPVRRARAGVDRDLESFGETLGSAVVIGIGMGQRNRADLAGSSSGLLETPFEGRSDGVTGVDQHEPAATDGLNSDSEAPLASSESSATPWPAPAATAVRLKLSSPSAERLPLVSAAFEICQRK